MVAFVSMRMIVLADGTLLKTKMLCGSGFFNRSYDAAAGAPFLRSFALRPPGRRDFRVWIPNLWRHAGICTCIRNAWNNHTYVLVRLLWIHLCYCLTVNFGGKDFFSFVRHAWLNFVPFAWLSQDELDSSCRAIIDSKLGALRGADCWMIRCVWTVQQEL